MQRRPVGDKSVGLAFWAAFLCYFLFLQKESRERKVFGAAFTPSGRELDTSCASVLCYFAFGDLESTTPAEAYNFLYNPNHNPRPPRLQKAGKFWET
jgi:hypothetical protein